ncbi:MAG: ComEA family DNA-binding protein [Salinibacter sp.]
MLDRLLACLLVAPMLASTSGAQPADTVRLDSTQGPARLERVLDMRPPGAQRTRRTVDALTRLATRPLDINRAHAAQLSTIPRVSPALARRIVRHRRRHGRFQSVRRLTAVDGLTRERLRGLRPYLRISSSPEGSPLDKEGILASMERVASGLDLRILQRATRELDPGRAFHADRTEEAFPGSPTRLTTRIGLSYGRQFEAALTLDKDPGEALRWQPASQTYGFDHLAGNVTLRDVGPVETLLLGDYTAEYGQGLALWQGLSFGKGRDPVSPLVRDGRGLVPFQSSSENRFFRGLATTVSLTPTLSVSAFGSRRRRDATLDSTSGGSAAPVVARTLSTGGLHRTVGQRRRRDALGLTTVGGALEYRTPRMVLGAAGYRNWFGRPLQPADTPYRRFDLSGTQATMGSVFATLFLDPYTVFGEVARAPSGSYGGLVGASLSHEAGVKALLLGRRYPRSFQGLHNGAIGESGDTQNEIGIYAGVRLRVADDWHVSAYVDQYQFPWLRFGVPRPSGGIDTRMVATYEPRPWLSSYVQVRAERETAGTERRGPSGRRLAALRTETRQSVRWHLEYTFREGLTLRTRLQGSRFAAHGAGVSRGVLLAQGLRLRPIDGLEIDARIALFDTDGYAARIYTYEHDLLYSFSVPVLYGQGQRSYVLAQYEPTEALTLEAKYGVTWYPHRQRIGSGRTTTKGSRVREIRVQARLNL